ncbi:MAG: hypothetical protein QW112_00775 [Candidatus Micrarchaeia archaeon]
MRCYACGSDTDEALGYWVDQGFICRVCADAQGFLPCAKCGRRFRMIDMKEWDGRFYCGNCVKVRKPIIRLKPISKLGGTVTVRASQISAPVHRSAQEIGLDSSHRPKCQIRKDRQELTETAESYKDLESEIKGEGQREERKEAKKSSLEELKNLADKLREARERKRNKSLENYNLKEE